MINYTQPLVLPLSAFGVWPVAVDLAAAAATLSVWPPPAPHPQARSDVALTGERVFTEKPGYTG